MHRIYMLVILLILNEKHNHKTTSNKTNHKQHDMFVYQCIKDHGGWDNWNMSFKYKTQMRR